MKSSQTKTKQSRNEHVEVSKGPFQESQPLEHHNTTYITMYVVLRKYVFSEFLKHYLHVVVNRLRT